MVFSEKCAEHRQHEAARCPECLRELIEDLVRDQKIAAVQYPWFHFRLFLWRCLQRVASMLLTGGEKELVVTQIACIDELGRIRR